MSHAQSPIPAEFHRLIADLLEDRLTDERYARLVRMTHENVACRDYYVDQMVVHSLLILDHREPLRYTPGPSAIAPLLNMPGDWLDSLDQGSQEPAPAVPPHGFFTGLILGGLEYGGQILARPAYFTALILFVMLTPLVLLLFLETKTEAPRAVQAPAPLIARLLEQTGDAKWVVSGEAILPGMDLRQGRELVLANGIAKIQFRDGATVLLKGPTTYRLDGSNGSFLRAGTLTAKVPPSASGFSVATPSATIVDLGTEFGVKVNAAAVTEAHVFSGEIELAVRSPVQGSKPESTRRLRAGEAVRIAMNDTIDSLKSLTADPKRFALRLPAQRDASPTPEFNVKFAHRGRKSPISEGWGGWNIKKKAENLVMKPIKNDQGTAAWSIADRSPFAPVRYFLEPGRGLSPEIIAEARTKGWVLRARAKVINNGPNSMCRVAYRDNDRDWVLGFSADAQGNQTVHLEGESSLGVDASAEIPNSRKAYIDYEVRYDPQTNDASVYVNGNLLASRFFATEPTAARSLEFSTDSEGEVEMRVALVEWGILQNEAN